MQEVDFPGFVLPNALSALRHLHLSALDTGKQVGLIILKVNCASSLSLVNMIFPQLAVAPLLVFITNNHIKPSPLQEKESPQVSFRTS